MIKSKVRLPLDNERIAISTEGKDEYAPRRMRITERDLDKVGCTVGRTVCRAANRGSTAVGHTEECRKQFYGRVGEGGRREE